MIDAPTIETKRLILRAYKPEDFDVLADFMMDSEVTRYLSGRPQSRADAWRGFATIIGHWVLRGYGFWAVERKEDGAFIGRIGLWNPEGWPGMEVGWTLGRPYWGQGYATEAAQASLDYGFLKYPVEKLLSVIHVDNRASQKVAERLGETKGERMDLLIAGQTFPVDVWEIAREKWLVSRF
jgi:RimJ/RimL family protein N-acetyltransferase